MCTTQHPAKCFLFGCQTCCSSRRINTQIYQRLDDGKTTARWTYLFNGLLISRSFNETRHFKRYSESAMRREIDRRRKRWQRKTDRENWIKIVLNDMCSWFDIEGAHNAYRASLNRCFTCQCDFQTYFPSLVILRTALFSTEFGRSLCQRCWATALHFLGIMYDSICDLPDEWQ